MTAFFKGLGLAVLGAAMTAGGNFATTPTATFKGIGTAVVAGALAGLFGYFVRAPSQP